MYLYTTIYNVTLTTAETEYSQALPTNTRKVIIKGRGNAGADIKVTFASGASDYFTISAGGVFSLDMVYLTGVTIYLKGTVSGEIAEILTFND